MLVKTSAQYVCARQQATGTKAIRNGEGARTMRDGVNAYPFPMCSYAVTTFKDRSKHVRGFCIAYEEGSLYLYPYAFTLEGMSL